MIGQLKKVLLSNLHSARILLCLNPFQLLHMKKMYLLGQKIELLGEILGPPKVLTKRNGFPDKELRIDRIRRMETVLSISRMAEVVFLT